MGAAGEMALMWQSARAKKPRQEICAPLKWFCFALNFAIFLVGVTCLALGIYLCTKDPRPIAEWADVALNPAVLITVAGLGVCFVSLCGLFGALRDNVFLLKTFALCVFCGYILLVIFTFVLFMLFYSDSADGISAHSVLLYSVRKYHTNRNIADFVDYLQEQLECCGTSQWAQGGFRDWSLNEQFACNATNPYPERCGVPFSCCRKSVVGAASAAAAAPPSSSSSSSSPQNGAANSLLPAMRSLACWQNAQSKRDSDLDADIYTRGCLQPLRALFEKYAMHFGAVVAAIILPVCFGVCLSQCLARQIDYQKYLLEREARRHERRKRRELRYADEQSAKRSQQQQLNNNNNNSSSSSNNNNESLMEQGRSGFGAAVHAAARKNSAPATRKASTSVAVGAAAKKSPPPNFPPPPTPRDEPDAAELAAALAASRRQWTEDEERRRRKQRRAVSTSPMRAHATGVGGAARTGSDAVAQTLEPRGAQSRAPNNSRDGRARRASMQVPGASATPTAPPAYGSHQQYVLKQSDFT